jgi:hypothetical protein
MWSTEMVQILRVLISDLGSTPTNSDDTLEQVILVAAFQTVQEVDFNAEYTISVPDETITPDPTDAASRDDAFINLVSIKAACLLDRSTAALAVKQGIYAVDGKSAVDLRGVGANKLKLLQLGWCAVYDDSKLEHESGQSIIAGAAVMTPFRVYATSGYYLRVPPR